MAVYLGGKHISETFDIYKSLLSHFSLCIIIPSSLHPSDVVSLLIFSSSYVLFIRLCVSLCVCVCVCPCSECCFVKKKKKNSPHRGNFAGICEQICYDFSFSLHLANVYLSDNRGILQCQHDCITEYL